MLALTRKKGESIVISDNIEVFVIGVQGDQVKLGIKAPRSVSIYRKEIYEQIQQQNKEAVNSSEDVVNKLEDLLKLR